MNKSKESPTNPFSPPRGWKLWVAQVIVCVVLFAIWSPIAAAIGISSLWASVIFVVAFTIFGQTPWGRKTEDFLLRVIRREG